MKGIQKRFACACRVDELKAKCASLNARAEQEKIECDTLTTCIRELEVAVVRNEGKLSVFVRVVRLLESHVTEGKGRANKTKNWARKMLDKMPRLPVLVEGQIKQSVGSNTRC